MSWEINTTRCSSKQQKGERGKKESGQERERAENKFKITEEETRKVNSRWFLLCGSEEVKPQYAAISRQNWLLLH